MQGERIFGLDLMRAVAIVLVVFDHNADVLGWFVYGAPHGSGINGVDLFFVLSGYLIGGILMKTISMDGVPWWRRILDFWQRRWLRTLPNYYLFLLINVVLLHFGLARGLLNHNAWIYAFFLQNLWKPVDLFFWESWSLVVEEWFYLLFPLALFALRALLRGTSRRIFLVAALVFIVAPAVLRLFLADGYPSVFELELGGRKLAVTRFDTIGFGSLAMWLGAGYAVHWKRLRWPLFCTGAGAVMINASFYGNDALGYSATWSFTVNAMAMAMLLPLLSTWERAPRGASVITFLSKVSYALYLVHQPLRAVWERLFEQRTPLEGVLLWLAYWAACIAISWLVYRFWERQFMELRDRIGKKVLA